MSTPRFLRALRFADEVMSIMRDFIPTDRECVRSIHHKLMKLGWFANVTIINVPQEWDELDKQQIERARLEAKFAAVIPVKQSE